MAQKSESVYLATDPDREGEAISWHLAQLLDLDEKDNNRVTFSEITKSGINSGMQNPRAIDMKLVDAQQARRVLDRIVGYKLSEFMWRKVRRGLSAGRVQSVAVRLVVDREEKIREFKPEEYWSIDAVLLKDEKGAKTFTAKYHATGGKKTELKSREEAERVLTEIKSSTITVESIKKGKKQRSPAPPFTTSTLQQEASRRLGFTPQRTMRAAQELYEGVTLPEQGAVGLITYMRTDSLRISEEALTAAREYIGSAYGSKYVPASPRKYKTKAGAQDGHEAIRPTMASLVPAKVKESLTPDQYKLYKLIWERFTASQMSNCVTDTVSANIAAGAHTLRASGFTVAFDGFTRLYTEMIDSAEESASALPALAEGETLIARDISANQHFTEPPARYTEATLIKALEENGIGRPSTYAPTISTIQQRGYVERESKAFKPTGVGETVTKLMREQFPAIVDVKFTADMEKKLDTIAEDGEVWTKVLDDFYKGFSENLTRASEDMQGKKMKVPDEETSMVCELCGKPMVIRYGKFGKFLACTGFPECKNAKNIVKETGGVCPKCGKKVISKKSKTGRTYYCCEDYPKCSFITWDAPSDEKCPKCGNTLFKTTFRQKKLHCLKEGCGYEAAVKSGK